MLVIVAISLQVFNALQAVVLSACRAANFTARVTSSQVDQVTLGK
jgi:hypothetical protein